MKPSVETVDSDQQKIKNEYTRYNFCSWLCSSNHFNSLFSNQHQTMNKNQYTVGELICALKQYPSDAIVWLDDPDSGSSYAIDITFEHNEVIIHGTIEEDD